MKRILIGVPLVGLSCCVVFGQATLYSLDGQTMGANSGSAVANAGDVNNDGFDDVILGAPNDLNGAGMASGTASVISGVDGATVWHFEGASAGDGFGGVVAGVGDLNGDSFDEVAVSASGFAGSTGQVLVYDGQTGTVMRTFNGRGVNDFFGVALASVGDLNADGLPDIAIGALGFDPQGPDFGMVQVYSGRTGVLFERGNPESLAQACSGLAQDAERGRLMGQEARLEYESRFAPTPVREQLEALYRSILR